MNDSGDAVAEINISTIASRDGLQLAILKNDPVTNQLKIGKIYRYGYRLLKVKVCVLISFKDPFTPGVCI